MKKQTASECIHQQMDHFQDFYDQCKYAYNQIEIHRISDDILLEQDIFDLAQPTKIAISQLSAFVKENQTRLLECGKKELGEWLTKFRIVLTEHLCRVLDAIWVERKRKNPALTAICPENQIREHLRRWIRYPMQSIDVFNYSLEVAILRRALVYFLNLLTGHCLYLKNRNAKLYERIWNLKLEDLSKTHYLEKRFEILLRQYPPESRTEMDYVSMRNKYLQAAPACILQDLRFNYMNPEVLIQLAQEKGLTEEEFKICIGISSGLTKLDRIQQVQGKNPVKVLTSLNVSECLDEFHKRFFGEMQALKDTDGKPLIREKGDWAYVGRIFKEQVDLHLFTNYKDFYQILVRYKVNNLPKDPSLLNKTVACISEKAVHPHWKCDPRALLIGQKTLELIEKYSYLLG